MTIFSRRFSLAAVLALALLRSLSAGADDPRAREPQDEGKTSESGAIDTTVRNHSEMFDPNAQKTPVAAAVSSEPLQVVSAFVGRPGAAFPITAQAGAAGRYLAEVRPSEMNGAIRLQLQGMAQKNTDQRISQAVASLLNNGDRALTIGVRVSEGRPEITGLSVAAQPNRAPLALAVTDAGVLALVSGGGRASSHGPNVNLVGAPPINVNLGGALQVPLANLRAALFAQNISSNPTADELNAKNIGGQFAVLLRMGPAEFRGIQNNPNSNYSQALKILTMNGYDAATQRFAAPPPGIESRLQQAWRLLNDMRR